MPCKSCIERRRAILDAWQDKQIAEAVKQAALGVREIIKGKNDGKE